MTSTDEQKEIARQARLLLAAARTLKVLTDEANAVELTNWRNQTEIAMNAMVRAAVTAPGLRIAIFAENEQEGK